MFCFLKKKATVNRKAETWGIPTHHHLRHHHRAVLPDAEQPAAVRAEAQVCHRPAVQRVLREWRAVLLHRERQAVQPHRPLGQAGAQAWELGPNGRTSKRPGWLVPAKRQNFRSQVGLIPSEASFFEIQKYMK